MKLHHFAGRFNYVQLWVQFPFFLLNNIKNNILLKIEPVQLFINVNPQNYL